MRGEPVTVAVKGFAVTMVRGPSIDGVVAELGKVPGISYAVGGNAPGYFDSLRQLDSSLPYVFAFVGVLAFVLLLVAFRSVAVSVTSIASPPESLPAEKCRCSERV